MPEPRIKEEQSPEPPCPAKTSRRRGAIAMLLAASPAERKRDEDTAPPRPKYTPRPLPLRAFQDAQQQLDPPKIKSESASKDSVVAAVPAPATDREALPQNSRLAGSRHASGRHGAQRLPVASSLSSRPVPVPQQTPAFTKTNPPHNFLAGFNRPLPSRLLVNHYALPTYTKGIQRVARMDNCNFGGGNELFGNGDMDFNAVGVYTGLHDQMPQTVTMPLTEYQSLRNEVYIQKAVMNELYTGSQNMRAMLHRLESRIVQLEEDNALSRTSTGPNMGTEAKQPPPTNANEVLDGDDNNPIPAQSDKKLVTQSSTKRQVAEAFNGEGVTMPGRTKYRKKLQVSIPDKVTAQPSGAGLPTPMPSAAPRSAMISVPTTPRTPYTPGRIGPPDSYKKTTTSINKRDIHNLNKSMPPQNVQLPMVPLTDTEVIVYFFNSLSKPAVSLRLYSRGWGPASIVQALNAHREVDPPYLRNTCSVKCTTAIKLGKKLYGEDWENEHRAAFSNAEDCKATDLIRVDENETVDYYVRALGVNLKQHPSGQEAGIFTACVQYCIKNNVSYTMSNVVQLAVDLQDGNNPQHPESPAPSDVAPVPQASQPMKDDDETGDEWSDHEAPGTPSPLAERASFLGRTGGSVNFTAVNAQQTEHDEEEV